MSGWIIALGLAAGYLINKNLAITGRIEKAVNEFEGQAAPATDGVTSAELRSAWKRTDHVKYGDMNHELPKAEKDALVLAEQSERDAVQKFDSADAPLQIQGVMLQHPQLGF